MKTATRDIRLTDNTFWNETYEFFHDKAKTEPFDLSEIEVDIVFTAGGPALTEGDGLTVTAEDGKVVIGAPVTMQMNGHYRMNWKLKEGGPQTPVWGKLIVEPQSSP